MGSVLLDDVPVASSCNLAFLATDLAADEPGRAISNMVALGIKCAAAALNARPVRPPCSQQQRDPLLYVGTWDPPSFLRRGEAVERTERELHRRGAQCDIAASTTGNHCAHHVPRTRSRLGGRFSIPCRQLVLCRRRCIIGGLLSRVREGERR